MKTNTRPCPICEHGHVNIAELNKGSRCSYCHRTIETDFIFTVGIPILAVLALGLAFNNGFAIMGFLLTGFMVFYSFAFDTVVARYLPLKHYGDSD